MNNKKTTKRALVTSILSLVLCMSMLIGTTFAWFTDNVSSKNNIIKSGNLDVEMEYYDGDSWEKVTENTNVFEENTLWEPGHTEVVYLKVSNLGTLALKYNLGINIVNEIESINVAGEALRLSDHIKFGAIEDVDTPYADRAAARAAVTESKILSTGYTKAGSIEAGAAADYVALVVYMPETVGNEANYRTGEAAPEITLGLNLMATQYTSEKDSFDNQYDANATFNGVPAARVTKLAKMPVVTSFVTHKEYTLDTAYVFNATETLDQAKQNAKSKWIADFVASFDQDVDSADIGLAGQYDFFGTDWLAFELEGMGTIAANTPVRMLRNDDIGTEFPVNYENLCDYVNQFQCGAFAVNPAKMAGKTMTVELRLYETEEPSAANGNSVNVETGNHITIGTYSYTFTYAAANSADLKNAINGGAKLVELGAGEFTLPTLANTEGVTIIGTEDTVIGGDSASTGFGGNFGKSTTIKNVTFAGSSNGVRYSYAKGGNTVFENCTFAGDSTYGFHIDESNGATFTFNNCTFSGFNAFASDLVKVTFNNCTFLNNGNYGHTNIWSVGEFNNCTFGAGATYGTRGSGVIYVDGVQQ